MEKDPPPAAQLAVLQNQMNNIEKNVEKLETKIDARFDNLEAAMARFVEKAEEKFANKWVEKTLIWGGSIVGSSLLLALMALILKS